MNNGDLMNMLMGALKSPGASEKLKDMMSFIGNSSESSSDSDNTYEENSVIPQLKENLQNEADTISMIKNMLDNFNRTDDNRIVLLNSIKPYMKPGRGKNIDTAVKFIQLLNFAKGFGNMR